MYVIGFIIGFILLGVIYVIVNTKEVDKTDPNNIQLLMDVKRCLLKSKCKN